MCNIDLPFQSRSQNAYFWVLAAPSIELRENRSRSVCQNIQKLRIFSEQQQKKLSIEEGLTLQISTLTNDAAEKNCLVVFIALLKAPTNTRNDSVRAYKTTNLWDR